MSQTKTEITATLVKETDRIDFLPDLFGPYCTAVRMRVYDYMTQMVEEYEGGYWDFYRLSNGGGFMLWDAGDMSNGGGFMLWDAGDMKKVHVNSNLNYYKGVMSPEAASLAMCALAINHTMWTGGNTQQIHEAWDRLMEYIYQHPESSEMLAFLD